MPWNLLIDARRRFESGLPVDRPLTEPDIALHLPGRYLILIEAKFTSSNTSYSRGPRADARSLTFNELVGIYQDPSLEILDVLRASSATRIHQQLWRNLLFAEWVARQDHPRTKAYHVNLVRQGFDEESAVEFARLVRPQFQDRFRQITWEWIYEQCTVDAELSVLRRYLETKTAGLRAAFQLV